MVGQTLADGFAKHGWGVVIGTGHPEKKIEWKDATLRNVKVTTYAEAAEAADLVVVAVKGIVAEGVVHGVASQIAGKVVIDASNPIADAPPDNGVLQFFTALDKSLMERLQKLAPEAHFVKAFNSVGAASMVNPDFGGMRPTMFICGNHAPSKKEVTAILEQFGWEAEDMGGVQGARAIEPLCMLWCIPGLLRNQWSHAFKLLKK